MAKKGNIPWNKGLTKETDVRVESYSKTLKGKPRNRVFTEEQRKANGDRTRERYANMTPEEKEEVSRIQQRANQKRWEGKEEEKKLYFKNFNELARNISPEKREAKNKKISEANKKPDSLRNNPETWRLSCSGCDSEISFEKYHRFQNAKSGVKKGHDLFCSECKEKNKLAKRNPLLDVEWKIECHDEECNVIIEYENYPAYKRALERIEAGAPKYCDQCRETKHPKKDGAKKKYSDNPDDWFIKCRFDDCEKVLTYNSYGSYAHNCKRILKGDPPMCYGCASKMKKAAPIWKSNREEKKLKRERQERIINQYKSFKTSEKRILRKEFQIRTLEFWSKLSDEEIFNIVEFINLNHDDLINKYDNQNSLDRSDRARLRLINSNNTSKIKPFVNLKVIDYIKNELNAEYDTTFIHGGSDSGEFRIYDFELKKLYFADAYCPKLNLWIEFDEKAHFKENELREGCQFRHQRIKKILNCNMVRIKLLKKKNNLQYFEYHNDFKNINGLN